jgi:hypothetical protein
VTADVAVVTRADTAKGITGFFGPEGESAIAGRASLLPRGALSEETVEEATTAGALAVLVDGPLPAGAFSLDVPAGVPVVGLPQALVKEIRSLLAAGIPVTVAIGSVDVAENVGGGSIAAFSSRGLAFGGGLKPDLLAAGVAVPTSEPGRGDEGEVRFGTVSGTSAAAAIAAGAAAVLAEGRPRVDAAGLLGLLVGSAQRTDLDLAASGAGLIDLRSAVQQEVVATPASVSFGTVESAPEFDRFGLERTVRIRNVSTRRLDVRIGLAALAPKGVEITVEPDRLVLRRGGGAEIRVRADTQDLSDEAGVATGELVLRVAGSQEARVPWAVAVPEKDVDLISNLTLRRTGSRISDATPAILGLVAGAVTASPDPQVRPVDALDVQLWRGQTLLGVLARRRELLPGRYTFGLTGRSPSGERLRRGSYVVRVVARPGDGTRRQVETIAYRIP